MKNVHLIFLCCFFTFAYGCAKNNADSEKDIIGYTKNSKFIEKNIRYNRGISYLKITDLKGNIINNKNSFSLSNLLKLTFISDDNSHFLATTGVNDINYYIVPYEYLYTNKIEFLDKESETEKINMIVSSFKNSKEITIDIIDELIAKRPKTDNFHTYSQNKELTTSFYKKFGLYKVTLDVKPDNYDPYSKSWKYLSKSLKVDIINNKHFIGTNAFGVKKDVTSSKSRHWTVFIPGKFMQSQDEARSVKSITLYGSINNAEIVSHAKTATIDFPAEMLIYDNRVDLDVVIGQANFTDGSVKFLSPDDKI